MARVSYNSRSGMYSLDNNAYGFHTWELKHDVDAQTIHFNDEKVWERGVWQNRHTPDNFTKVLKQRIFGIINLIKDCNGIEDYGIDKANLKVVQVSKAYYHSELSKLPEDKRKYIDDVVVADKYYLVFHGLAVGGFATNKSGYLTGLFSLVKGLGRTIFELRLAYAIQDKETNKSLTLFCIGDFLRDLYKDYGFKVYNTIAWDDNYAPKGWDYAAKGRPNLYEMIIMEEL